MNRYQLYLIPFQDKFLIYRPLRHLAFVGNQMLADLAQRYCDSGEPQVLAQYPEVAAFFESQGFLQTDPIPQQLQRSEDVYSPLAAALLMTNRCNLRCIYCYANGGEEAQMDLPLSYGKQAIDIVAHNAADQNKGFAVTFHGGGEPTLAWDSLLMLAEYAREKTMPAKLAIVSNGAWPASHCDPLMRLMDEITISMDGGSVTQNLQRPTQGGGGSFKNVMRSVEYLSAKGFPFSIRMTATPERFDTLVEDVRFLCQETSCRAIQAEPAFYQHRGAHSSICQNEGQKFSQVFLEAYDVARSLERPLYYSGARPRTLTDIFCEAPLGGSLTVNPLGEITGCYECTGRENQGLAVFGKMDDFGIAIDEEKRRAFVSSILRRKDRCKDCFCYFHCAGDCFTRGLENPDGQWPYTRCEMNRTITLGLLLRSIAETR